MANEVTVDRKLSEIFAEGYELYESVAANEGFGTAEFQEKVKKCTANLEDSTRLVTIIGMFSPNEGVEEIATDNLRYLLLPFLLGQLSTKLSSAPREEALRVAQIYYRDFLKRCEDYAICQKEEEPITESHGTELENLTAAAGKRNRKLAEYKMQKELEEQIKMLKVAIQREDIDDEVKRDFYMKLINASIMESRNELESIKQETEILQYRKTINPEEDIEKKAKGHARREPERLKPIIITRNAAQKAIFGMGYPSLPVMTVKDFYEQRVREGIFPDPEKVTQSTGGLGHDMQTEEKEELEKAEKELLEEEEDEEYLARQRAMDEYKDVVRRGDGNRHNRS